ncbi:unnamed protein product [Boreogadus saida]
MSTGRGARVSPAAATALGAADVQNGLPGMDATISSGVRGQGDGRLECSATCCPEGLLPPGPSGSTAPQSIRVRVRTYCPPYCPPTAPRVDTDTCCMDAAVIS